MIFGNSNIFLPQFGVDNVMVRMNHHETLDILAYLILCLTAYAWQIMV